MPPTNETVTEFTIDRATWIRGDVNLPPGAQSVLLSVDGCRCCLGFYGKALGYGDEELLNAATPGTMRAGTRRLFPEWLVAITNRYPVNTTAATDLMDTNDSRRIGQSNQESYISEVFADNGVKVTFK